MHLDNLFPSRFLKAADLQNKTVSAIIEKIKMVDVVGNGRPEDQKPALFFKSKDKALVLNKTNATSIAGRYGKDTSTWAGKPIELFPDLTLFQGRSVDCVRVRVPAPPATDGKEEFNDDIPF